MADMTSVERGAANSAALGRATEVTRSLLGNIETVVHGKHDQIALVLASFACEGHVLLEDVPGTAKTVLARALAGSVEGATVSRIQCTPDLQPTDVTGLSVWDPQERRFEFRPGPIFANVLLVDEINRASPKTQSALLEAMQETQVTIDGVTYALELPFFVVATQNPIEYEGTYPLPEAQLDRFTARLSLGYPPFGEEARMLAEQTTSPPLDHLAAVADAADLIGAIENARAVFVEETVGEYVVALIRHTRVSTLLALGASPRAGIALLRMAKARAAAQGRDYVVPEDVQAVAGPVLSHRVILAPEARASGLRGEDAVERALSEVPIPK
jgi:MoxR-like ATPase